MYSTSGSPPGFELGIHPAWATPGGVARTSTQALNNATLPFTLELADKGWRQALLDNAHLRNGLYVCHGKITYKAVADDLGYSYVDPVEAIKAAS